jgi:hypothetical protein
MQESQRLGCSSLFSSFRYGLIIIHGYVDLKYLEISSPQYSRSK